MSTSPESTLSALQGGIIVSCQAYPGEPMNTADTMRRVAQAVALGGAAAIRTQGLDLIKAIHAAVSLPLIGLWKDGDSGVVITPTLQHALQVALAGSDIVALDATARPRRDGRTVAETVRAVHEETAALLMADVSTYDEGLAAQDAGADLVGTTLSGYTERSPRVAGPDLALVRRLASTLTVPVIAEGRIHRPEDVSAALAQGAFAVVVGTAITHPTTLTRWFVDAATDNVRGRVV